MATTCAQCNSPASSTASPTGRPLCGPCSLQLYGLAGAGTSLVSGGSPGDAIGTAIATAGHADSMDVEGQHRASQRKKLAAADGFWARLKIRLIG